MATEQQIFNVRMDEISNAVAKALLLHGAIPLESIFACLYVACKIIETHPTKQREFIKKRAHALIDDDLSPELWMVRDQ